MCSFQDGGSGLVFRCGLCVCAAHQDRVLHIISQQARVVQGVFGFLHSHVHRPFFNLVLDGSEQFVQGLACRVLEHTQEDIKQF